MINTAASYAPHPSPLGHAARKVGKYWAGGRGMWPSNAGEVKGALKLQPTKPDYAHRHDAIHMALSLMKRR